MKNRYAMSHRLLTLLGSCLAVGMSVATAQDIVKVGEGSYTTVNPGVKDPPGKIYKTDNVKGATPTNQWWSSLVFQKDKGNDKFSQPLFPHPLTVTYTKQGVTVAYLGGNVKGGNHIEGPSTNPKDADFDLGNSEVSGFSECGLDGYSDWFVTGLLSSSGKSLRGTIGHGSPFVYATLEGGDPTVSARKGNFTVWSGSEKTPVLGVTINGHHYGLFGATGSTWTGLGSNKLTNSANGKNYFSLALLPDNSPETLESFTKVAYNHVTNSELEWKVDGGNVKGTYKFTVKPYEGSGSDTMFALYPHQWKYATSKLGTKSYGSPRGEMKLAGGPSFTTEVPIQGLLPYLPPQGLPDTSRAIGYVKEVSNKKIKVDKDTYFEGKDLGRFATMSGVAEAAGDLELQAACISELKRCLEDWLTASPGKKKVVFYYNSNWGTLIGSPASFFSDSSLNDHHFHYGYYIRAAGEVARVDPAWGKKWAPMVNILIREIASLDRKDPLFPYMRCFDRYAGHSWASGDANFADGNNQESSSESMNAWYGLMLWGQATGDIAARDLALFLFNTERTAVEEYWFDVNGTNFPKGFQHVALGMVWGSKGAFSTWFSGDVDCIHGINWLPFTPASIYMGRNPAYVKKNFDSIMSTRKHGSFNEGWGDLVCMFGALNDPGPSAKYMDSNPSCKIEDGNSHAFMYHWLNTLDKVGLNDGSVTADYPIYNVYKKDGTKTYAVYNYEDKPLTVKFSDGKTVSAPKKGLTVDAGK